MTWVIEWGGYRVSLSGRQLEAFVKWLKMSGRLREIQAALDRGDDQESARLTVSAYLTWRARGGGP